MDRERTNRDVVPEFATRLKLARLAIGLSQAELARRAGTSQASVARIEDCQRAPTLRLAERLLTGLGVYLHDLLPRRPGPHRQAILDAMAQFSTPPAPDPTL